MSGLQPHCYEVHYACGCIIHGDCRAGWAKEQINRLACLTHRRKRVKLRLHKAYAHLVDRIDQKG